MAWQNVLKSLKYILLYIILLEMLPENYILFISIDKIYTIQRQIA